MYIPFGVEEHMKNRFLFSGSPSRPAALIFLTMTAVLWSLGGFLIKWISWNPIAIAGMRSAIAAILILVLLGKPKITLSPAQLLGAVAYSATVILFVVSNKYTTAANAIMLQYTAPIYVAIFSAWFLKERTRFLDWVAITLVMGGMVLFFMDHLTPGGTLGNILSILSGFSFACLVLLLRKQKDSSPIESILLGNIVTALIGLPFMFGKGPGLQGWIGLLLLGTLQLGISYILYSIAIKQVTAIEAILIPVIEPVLNPVWVFLLLGEKPGFWAIVGGVVIIMSITGRCVLIALRSSAPDNTKALNQ